ncbi:MAG TPA: glycine cleavage system aminomethyltransferase GcvT [Balneolaceae bacterium]|nr:glycine cleavage system aminomethyltransferase GcvT [Balneolaceae bacterium]
MPEQTPLYDLHEELGAKITNFGGWQMPVRYSSIKKEHTFVRNKVGLFDVSHMGELFINGPEALQLLQFVTINDASKLKPGKAQYSAMCHEDGGVIDDLIIYMLDENEYMLVVNASNIEKDFNWITGQNRFDAEVQNRSSQMCLFAIQGPDSPATLQKITEADLSSIKFYTFRKGKIAGFDNIIISATGYTGEKGFEIYFNQKQADPIEIWKAIMEAGAEFDIQPCGLGARDTLRLEMGFDLYGNDITEDTNPLEARLGWLTKLDKGDFVGKKALQEIKDRGIKRKLIGFVIEERRAIPRSGYAIFDENDNETGIVTSGTRSISLNKNIGLGYVPIEQSKEGTHIYIKVRNTKAEALVTKPPFVNKK